MKHFTIKLTLALFMSAMFSLDSVSQISGTNSVLTMNANTATVVDNGLTISMTGNISDVLVQIQNGYVSGGSGDILSYTGSLPSGITANFDNVKGILGFSGTTTAANWQALLRTVTIQSTSSACFAAKRSVTFVLGNKLYNPDNGHYYMLDVFGNWDATKAAAENSTYFGRIGYLATITSSDENNFLFSIVNSSFSPWIGASDNYLKINAATGVTTYANQAAAEGNFYWISGPEAGTPFSQKNYWQSGGTTAVSGRYMNWNSSEPNDWPDMTVSSPGEEDYGQFYPNTGGWNDADGALNLNSIIEFGDMPNDAQTNNVAHTTRNILINSATLGTISSDFNVCTSGSNSPSFTLSGNSSGSFSVVRWESSPDRYFSNPTTISNTSTTLSLSNINQNTYYRAIVTTSGPTCTNVPTSVAGVKVNSPGSWIGGTSTDWTTSGNWCGGTPSLTTDVVIPPGTLYVPNTPSTGNTCRNLTIKDGASVVIDKKLQIAGTIFNYGQLDATGGEVSFKGSAAQVISSSAFLTNKVKNLTIDNSNGVTLSSGNLTVTGTLTFVNGIVNTSASNLLIIDDNATATGFDGSKYVDGPLRKVGDDQFLFPVGDAGKYAPCDISSPSNTTDHFTAEYFKSAYPVLDKSGISTVSKAEYWNIDRSGSSGVNLALYFFDPIFSGIPNTASTDNLIVAHFNEGNQYWEDLGGSRGIEAVTGGMKVFMGVNSFSPFTFGSPNGLNPLPVKLISFVATPNNVNRTVELKWETTSEENSKYYEVLHSVDFVNWKSIGTVNSTGSSNLNKYTFNHMQPSEVNHYKLKEVENNGKYAYSDIKLARFTDVGGSKITVYPNPSVGSVTVSNAGEEANYELIDFTGKVIRTGAFDQTITIGNLPKGVYMIKIVCEGIIQNERIVVQ